MAHELTQNNGKYIATRYFGEAEMTYRALSAKMIGDMELNRFLTDFLPLTAVGDKSTSEAARAEDESALKSRDKIRHLVETGLGTDIPGVRGTAWGLYNAATEWIDRAMKSALTLLR